MDLLQQNASNATVLSAEAERVASRTTEANEQCGNLSAPAVTCIFLPRCIQRERFARDTIMYVKWL